ncbi:MAG: NUDIX domain-containing protein [Bacteroidales bacterium]|jgi:8-oxo-dGTP pyrophosphatase MutT (NUDIX family)|nr:NUDIX domain-containing protein [Bacteroidales bacterium]
MKYPVRVFIDNELHVINNSNSWQIFLSGYTLIEAAGAVIWNKKKEFLMIFRYGKWEFPKGKVEEGEAFIIAAVREATEETGLQQLQPLKEIMPTYHTYTSNRQNFLKRTHWYLMQAECSQPLQPQEEEGITKVEWIPYKQVASLLRHSYQSLFELWETVQKYLKE